MLRLLNTVNRNDPETVMQQLAQVVERLPHVGSFCAGPNRDYEQKSSGFTYGFTLDARDAAALDAYANDAEHKRLGAMLVAMCEGGAEGVMVFDLEVPL